MLTEMMVRKGRAVKESDWMYQERIALLTDVHSENCKNYFQNVLIVEWDGVRATARKKMIGQFVDKNKFEIDKEETPAFPVIFPHGGNPLHAQGIYPLPCYLLYDPHMKSLTDPTEFVKNFLLPRFRSTVTYLTLDEAKKELLAERVAFAIAEHAHRWISEEKQLGVLIVVDHSLTVFQRRAERFDDESLLWIAESDLQADEHLYLNAQIALDLIVEAKFREAGSLGMQERAISTFTNEISERVVSVYNKSWLWLSPTWDLPKSIYWKDDEWTKGIRIDPDSYEAFLYGSQLLKKITVPIRGSILKEMFAPIQSAEAKQHMKWSSFESVYGAPIILSLTDKKSTRPDYLIYEQLTRNPEELNANALHLEVLFGIECSFEIEGEELDDKRLTLLYYSGDLSRGNMFVRAVIEDVVPSVAKQVYDLVQDLASIEAPEFQEILGIPPSDNSMVTSMYDTLPALLGNAYGSGYFWQSLQSVLHRRDIFLDRMAHSIARKLNELANKNQIWAMKRELLFFFCFLHFYQSYTEQVQRRRKDVRGLRDWQQMMERYHRGEIAPDELAAPDALGFVSGLMLRQFEQSYYQKTKKRYLKDRVMKFGSKLTPLMIWENGLLRSFELEKQWELGIADSYYSNIPSITAGFNALIGQDKSKNALIANSDFFMNMFWAGFHMYKNPKKNNDK